MLLVWAASQGFRSWSGYQNVTLSLNYKTECLVVIYSEGRNGTEKIRLKSQTQKITELLKY